MESPQPLLPDLANLQHRNAATVTALERRLSQVLGESVWRESGLGAPVDIDALQRRSTKLGQANIALRAELVERGEELDAARATDRELRTRLSTPSRW